VSLVVSDTSPIRYLILCGTVDVLPHLYDQVVIPSTVREELAHPHAPAEVRGWVSVLPDWVRIQAAQRLDPSPHLGLGEREAIALARELQATALLVDERAARRVAAAQGLAVTGTVGVLERAAERGLLHLSEALRRLTSTNFRIAPEMVQEALHRHAGRPFQPPRERGLER
jgi:predicted nucleic acid-binding protein